MKIEKKDTQKLETLFLRPALETLPIDEMKCELSKLDLELCAFLQKYKMTQPQPTSVFQTDVQKHIIEALRSAGHDLWSWNFDGSHVETWGHNYLNFPENGFLLIDIHRDWKARSDWVLSPGRTIFERKNMHDFEDKWTHG